MNIGQIGGPNHGEQTSKLHQKMLQKLGNISGLNIPDFLKCWQHENKPKQMMVCVSYIIHREWMVKQASVIHEWVRTLRIL